ncbi:MAG: TolC family protein [Bacteroidia bacterium]|nr:TolC family protein [Bacteroidia bacterium]
MKKLTLIFMLLAFPVGAIAQTGEEGNTQTADSAQPAAQQLRTDGSTQTASGKMTLRDCMLYALEHSADIQIRQTETADARVDRREAILRAFTPSLSGSTYAYSYFGRNIDPETNTYVNTSSFNNGLSVSSGITLFDGFSAINNLRIAQTSVSMGLSTEIQEEDKVCLATMEAFFNVIYYTSLVQIISEQTDNARSALILATRQEELGSKGHADVVQMQADLSDREYELVSAQNSLQNAIITLKDVMLWPLDEELVLDTDIEKLAPESKPLALEEISANAEAFLPKVSISRGTRDNARLELQTAKWRFLPSLALYGGWSSSYYTYPGDKSYVPTPYFEQLKRNAGEYVQLSLSIPIYGRFDKINTLSRKRNAYRRASLQYDKTLREVESEVRRAMQDRDGAQAALLQAERRSEVQNEAYKLNFKKFDQGLISSIEYQTAAGNYMKARAEQLNAHLQYLLKERVVRYYNGERYIDQQ